MSVKEVKELFYLATNAKMVVGGDQKHAESKPEGDRNALHCSLDECLLRHHPDPS